MALIRFNHGNFSAPAQREYILSFEETVNTVFYKMDRWLHGDRERERESTRWCLSEWYISPTEMADYLTNKDHSLRLLMEIVFLHDTF